MIQKLSFHLQCNKAWALLCLLSSLTSYVYGAKIKCTSATVQIGQSATLTCTFGNEISQLQTNIYVDHQQTLSVEDHELVVACQWKPEGFTCRSIPGFEVVGDVTNQLTFRIKEVLQKHAGNYTCDVLESSFEKNSCVLTVTGTTNTSPTLNTHPSDKEENECEGSRTCFERNIIIGLAVAVACMFITLIAVIILLRRNTQSSEDFKSRKPTPIYKKVFVKIFRREGYSDTQTNSGSVN